MDSETVEEIKRHFGVVAEDLRSDIRVIAEGQDLLRDRLEVRVGVLEERIGGLTEIVQLVHSEVSGRLNDHERRLSVLEQKSTRG